MTKKSKSSKSLFSWWNFIPFFFTVSFVVTCSFRLFFAGTDIGDEIFRERAPITFGNVIFLSVIFTLIDFLRRKLTIERPVKELVRAGKRICEGDFSVRIENHYSAEFEIIAEQFNKMAEELGGIETLRSDFIANVSHELKTPLAAIQNYATFLSEPDLSEEKRIEYAKAITHTTKRFSEMIGNILKLNKLENQQIYPNAAEYELNEQLCECLLNYEEQISEKDIEIETNLDDVVMINADAELLSLVWNNLFSNAVKFSENGGKITVELTCDNEYAAVKISDTGCGISPETKKHIFEKFYQSDTSHSTKGNGLGLALVKRVIDITDGEISVESEVGKGSTFTVRLRRGTINGQAQENS